MYKVKKYNKLTKSELQRFWDTIELECQKDTSPAMVNMHSKTCSSTAKALRPYTDCVDDT
jgi:hypothetical protein